jgi:hypothetical protein
MWDWLQFNPKFNDVLCLPQKHNYFTSNKRWILLSTALLSSNLLTYAQIYLLTMIMLMGETTSQLRPPTGLLFIPYISMDSRGGMI